MTKIQQTKDFVDLNLHSFKFVLNLITEVLIVIITVYSCGNLLVA